MFEKLQTWAKDLKRYAVVLWFALKNPQTPFSAKVLAFLTVTYALSPIDLIPDFIPVLGYLDDLIIVPLLIWITLKLVPEDIMSLSGKQAQEWFTLNQSKPKSYLGLLIILAIWILLIFLIINSLF